MNAKNTVEAIRLGIKFSYTRRERDDIISPDEFYVGVRNIWNNSFLRVVSQFDLQINEKLRARN